MSTLLVCLLLLCPVASSRPTNGEVRERALQSGSDNKNRSPNITEEQAISIAKQDAVQSGIAIDEYKAIAVDEKDMWHIILEPKDKKRNVIEPTYLIFKVNGKVFEKHSRHLPHGPKAARPIDSDRAISIAKEDAARKVHIDEYNVYAFDEKEFWHVVFLLKDTNKVVVGGGPDYLIDRESGKIVQRKFYQ